MLSVCVTAERKDEGAVVEHPFLGVRTRHEYVLHQEDTRLDCSRCSRGLERRAVDAVFRYLYSRDALLCAVIDLRCLHPVDKA